LATATPATRPAKGSADHNEQRASGQRKEGLPKVAAVASINGVRRHDRCYHHLCARQHGGCKTMASTRRGAAAGAAKAKPRAAAESPTPEPRDEVEAEDVQHAGTNLPGDLVAALNAVTHTGVSSCWASLSRQRRTQTSSWARSSPAWARGSTPALTAPLSPSGVRRARLCHERQTRRRLMGRTQYVLLCAPSAIWRRARAVRDGVAAVCPRRRRRAKAGR